MKKARRTRPRRHCPPRGLLSTPTGAAQSVSTCEDGCVAGALKNFPFVAFSSLTDYQNYLAGSISPKQLPDLDLSSSNQKSQSLKSKLRSNLEPSLSDSDGPLLNPDKNYPNCEASTSYNPDTESAHSEDSESTEYFRPHSATLRQPLPIQPKQSRSRKRKNLKQARKTIKREPRDIFEARLQHQVLTYQHHHQHSHHHTMALPILPLSMNWPLLHLNDPLLMATLQSHHQTHLALLKPLKSATPGKWNGMHGKIARFIQSEKQKLEPATSKRKERDKTDGNGDSESPQNTPSTSKPRIPAASTGRRLSNSLSSRADSMPSAFAAIVASVEGKTLWDRQWELLTGLPHFGVPHQKLRK